MYGWYRPAFQKESKGGALPTYRGACGSALDRADPCYTNHGCTNHECDISDRSPRRDLGSGRRRDGPDPRPHVRPQDRVTPQPIRIQAPGGSRGTAKPPRHRPIASAPGFLRRGPACHADPSSRASMANVPMNAACFCHLSHESTHFTRRVLQVAIMLVMQ
jgi:hypothetical protein